MDYLRGANRLREDPDFGMKLGVGSVLYFSTSCIPFVGQLVMTGWAAAMVRQAAQGREGPQPRLDFDVNHLISLAKTGWRPLVASFVWMMPALLLMSFGWGAMVVMTSVAAGSSDGGQGVAMLLQCFGLCGMPLLMLLGALMTLPMQIAMLRAELTEDLSQALAIGEVLAMTKLVLRELTFGTLILSAVGSIGLMIAAMLCYFPMYPVLVLLAAARAHFAAQLYQLALQRGMQPLQIAQTEVDVPQFPAHSGGFGM